MTRPQIEPTTRRTRGRPKGSGIDDAVRLGAIQASLASNRSLRPTTAIKQAGVTDPSAIRRLREKLRAGAVVKPRLAVAALATQRAETVTGELPTSPPLAVPSDTDSPIFGGKHPPLAADTEKRTREALLLAAYLEAMVKSPPMTERADPRGAMPGPAHHDPAPVERQEPAPRSPDPIPPTPNPQTSETRASGPPPQAPFNFPGMPPFLQPFSHPQATPQPGTSQGQQLEGMKLAVEAMTSMTKLQLHITENAFAYSPLAMMLQGQAMVGQMLLASFTGQLDAMKPKKPK